MPPRASTTTAVSGAPRTGPPPRAARRRRCGRAVGAEVDARARWAPRSRTPRRAAGAGPPGSRPGSAPAGRGGSATPGWPTRAPGALRPAGGGRRCGAARVGVGVGRTGAAAAPRPWARSRRRRAPPRRRGRGSPPGGGAHREPDVGDQRGQRVLEAGMQLVGGQPEARRGGGPASRRARRPRGPARRSRGRPAGRGPATARRRRRARPGRSASGARAHRDTTCPGPLHQRAAARDRSPAARPGRSRARASAHRPQRCSTARSPCRRRRRRWARRPWSARGPLGSRSSTRSPTASMRAHCASVYGFVTRGSSWKRVTTLEKSRVTSQGSTTR